MLLKKFTTVYPYYLTTQPLLYWVFTRKVEGAINIHALNNFNQHKHPATIGTRHLILITHIEVNQRMTQIICGLSPIATDNRGLYPNNVMA
jgi:hypothetical protein